MAPMNGRRVYLHVGTPKSGTSYLQDRFARNRDLLERAGHRLRAHPQRRPLRGGARPARAALGGRRGRGRGGSGRRWPPRRGGAGAHVLVSHEILAGADPAAVATRPGLLPRPRAARGAHRARPRPADPGRVAGAREAPRPARLRGVPATHAALPRRHREAHAVLAGAGRAPHPGDLGGRAAPRTGARRHRRSPRRPLGPALGPLRPGAGPRRSRRAGPRARPPTPPSAGPRSPCCAGSTPRWPSSRSRARPMSNGCASTSSRRSSPDATTHRARAFPRRSRPWVEQVSDRWIESDRVQRASTSSATSRTCGPCGPTTRAAGSTRTTSDPALVATLAIEALAHVLSQIGPRPVEPAPVETGTVARLARRWRG